MEPVPGEVWQESDGVLVVFRGYSKAGDKQWMAFHPSAIEDEALTYPLRRVLDSEGKFVPEVAEYL